MKTFSILLICSILGFAAPVAAQYSIFPQQDGIGEEANDLDPIEQGRHANLARCLCDEAAEEGDYYSYYLEMAYAGALDSTDHYYYLGSDCANTAVALTSCAELATVNVNAYQDSYEFIPLPVNYLVDPEGGVCSEINSGSNTYYIFSARESRDVVFSKSFSYDTEPPNAPYNVTASSGESALTVKWDSADVDEEGIEYFNVLCSREGVPGEAASEDKADWVDTEEVCGKIFTDDATATNNINNTNNTNTTNNTNNTNNTNTTNKSGYYTPPVPQYNNRQNVYAPPPPNVAHNTKALSCPNSVVVTGGRPYKCFVCATVSRTSSSVRINGLENGVTYTVAVVAVDEQRNVSVLSNTATEVPQPTTDFGEHYAANGGSASGDYCFIATKVFGNKDHAGVQILRLFRDDILLTTSAGRDFVSWYYANGEGWANWLSDKPVLSFIVKVALIPVIFIAMLIIVTPWWGWFLFGAFFWYLYNRKRLGALLSKVSMKYAS